MSTSFKNYWIDHYKNNLDYFDREVVSPDNQIAGIGSVWLTLGVFQALYAHAPRSIVQKFLDATIDIVNRSIAEVDFEHGKYHARAYPLNRGEEHQVRAYARALRDGVLSTDDLLQASVDFEQWVHHSASRTWDDQDEAIYLNAARMALIAGDRERFAALLKPKRSFKWHAEEHAIYKAMAKEFEHAGVIEIAELKARFQALFDKYRDPEFKPDFYSNRVMVRFELSIIWRKYFFPPSEFTWQKVIDAVSA